MKRNSTFIILTVVLTYVFLSTAVHSSVSVIAPVHNLEVDVEGKGAAKPVWQSTWDNARQFAKQNRLEESQQLYQTLLRLKPNIVEARWEYCKLLIALGSYQEAAITVEQLLELEPRNLDFLITAGDLALRNNHFKKAVNYYGQVYEFAPFDKRLDTVVRGLVQSFKALQKDTSAFILLEQHYHRNRSDIGLLADLAQLSESLGMEQKARHFYGRLAAINPADLQYLTKAAELHEEAGLIDEAAKYWQQYLEIDAGYLPFHRKLSDYYLSKDKYNEALPHLITLYKKDGLAPSLALNIANIYQQKLKRPDKALLYYEQYLYANPSANAIAGNITAIRKALASQYLPIVENGAAESLWEDLELISAEKEEIFHQMAEIFEQQGKTQQEIIVLELLSRYNRASLTNLLRLAILYNNFGKIDQAYALLEKIHQESYADKSYLLVKANVERKKKLEIASLSSLLQYLQFIPEDQQVLVETIKLAGRLGDVGVVDLLRQRFLTNIANTVDNNQIYLAFIEALRENGQFYPVAGLYEELFKVNTNFDETYAQVLFHQADTLLLQGAVFEAEATVRQVLAKNLLVDQALAKLVDYSTHEGRPDKARSWLTLLANRKGIEDVEDPEEPLPHDIHFLLVQILINETNYDDAEELLLEHPSFNHSNPENTQFRQQTHRLLAQVYFYQEEYVKCLRFINKEGKNTGRDQEFYVLNDLASEYSDSPAVRLEDLTGTSFTELYERAYYYMTHGRYNKALQSIDAGLLILPEAINAQLRKAKIFASLADYQQAIQIVTLLSERFPKEEYLATRKLELEFKSGNFREIVKSVKAIDLKNEEVKTAAGETSGDIAFWKNLMLARALWAENRKEEAIKVYESLLAVPVDSMFLERIELENINFNLLPLKKSFWNMVTFTSPDAPDPIATVMEPQFVAQNIGQPVDAIAASLYDKYRWQKLVKKELSARQAAEERDYYRAEKEYLALLKEEKSEETLFDLAYIYNKLGHYGKEAEIYERIKRKSPLYPGLDEYIEANVLKRQPRISATFTNLRRLGRDGYINIKKRIFGAEAWLMPTYDQEVKIGLYRNSYSSFDRQLKSWSNRIMGTYSTYFEDSLDLNVSIGTDNPTDEGSTEILYKFELRGRLSDSVEAYGRFEQDLVEDTMRSVNDSIIYRDLEAGIKYDLIPRLFIGADYRFRSYSDDNEQNRYKLWTSYHLFGEMSQLKLKYSYENIRHNSENVGRDGNFRNFFPSDDRVYWSPNHYWQHLLTIHFRHLFEVGKNPEDPISYFSFDYSYGYEEDFNQIHGFDVNIFLEMDRHFLLKGNVNNLNGDDYEETQAIFSLIYRW